MAFGISKDGFNRLAQVSKRAEVDSSILKGFVDVAWGMAWANFWENLEEEYGEDIINEAIQELDLNLYIPNFMGARIEEIMDEPPPGAVQKCEEVLGKIAKENNKDLASFAEELGISSEELGNELAFHNTGSGGGSGIIPRSFKYGYDLEHTDLAEYSDELMQLANYLYENYEDSE